MPRNLAPGRASVHVGCSRKIPWHIQELPGASGLVAVVVWDAVGCLLVGLDVCWWWVADRCTLPPTPCYNNKGHADVGWHGLAQVE